jgi:Tfp pilus assembly protein PilZ
MEYTPFLPQDVLGWVEKMDGDKQVGAPGSARRITPQGAQSKGQGVYQSLTPGTQRT